ncbi:hypothetical protein MT325_m127R [Paramecium bursaria chlorella virus MT325]|uniref:Uncharacterized protein m127R n=1 Tax=Paramecium bursaria Chlorella virus MT325 TaxID=346932 RepID=A7ITK7_PBCVM|nr:hypothetical protein MT325_m127R [Paramecium bursaria chlorella virus MT325]
MGPDGCGGIGLGLLNRMPSGTAIAIEIKRTIPTARILYISFLLFRTTGFIGSVFSTRPTFASKSTV